MENKHLIDLSVKYGLDSTQLNKLVDLLYQNGIQDMNSREFRRVSGYICEMKLVDKPSEEIVEELKRKGLFN